MLTSGMVYMPLGKSWGNFGPDFQTECVTHGASRLLHARGG